MHSLKHAGPKTYLHIKEGVSGLPQKQSNLLLKFDMKTMNVSHFYAFLHLLAPFVNRTDDWGIS